MSKDNWTPDSWKNHQANQQPQYEDKELLNEALSEVRLLPPLVFAGEVDELKKKLSMASQGDAFILQGGDCAERFVDCNEKAISNKLKILLQMSMVLCYGLEKPIIRIGRIAGQYAKPRSSATEVVNGEELPVYRGDIVNSIEATAEARKADPSRIKDAYFFSALTINYIRSLTKGGFADLNNPNSWKLDFEDPHSDSETNYLEIKKNIQKAIHFIRSTGANVETLETVEFYTSHEGLILDYEQALTKYVPEKKQHYNLGSHILWIGDRTRDLNGAHIEYFRGIANPVGLKVGPTMEPDELVQICRKLNPNNEHGKLVLISRFGDAKISEGLKPLLQAVKDAEVNVCWIADPMHGNTFKTNSGIKTRSFDKILSEIKKADSAHKTIGTSLNGIHFELTGENVTECVGGAQGLKDEHLSSNYKSYCDPRLNYNQSLEIALLLSEMLS